MKYYYTPLFIISLLSPFCQAAPPTITNIVPRGLERGKPVELMVTGTNLAPEVNLLVPFKAEVKRLPDPKPNPAQARFQVTAAPDTPVGFFLVRAFGPEGVSPPTVLAVDPFPSLAEKEDNNSIEKAQLIPLPVVLDGQCAGGDVDFYRFDAKKGQRLVIETEAARIGSGVLPQLRLTDDKGRFLAGDDTRLVQGDARLFFSAPHDGSFVIEFSDTRYRGGNPPNYRLKIGDYDVAEEVFPPGIQLEKVPPAGLLWRGGNLDKDRSWEMLIKDNVHGLRGSRFLRLNPAKDWKEGMAWPELLVGSYRHRTYQKPGGLKRAEDDWVPPFTIQGRLDKSGESHRLAFPVKEGEKLRFIIQAQNLGSRLDGVIKLLDDKGKVLAQADDVDYPALAPGQPAFKSLDPVLEFTVPKGLTQMEVELRDGLGRGGINFGYLLTIEPAEPDFLLRLQTGEVNLPRDGFDLVRIAVTRRGYDGPIQLGCKELPPGWKVHGGMIPTKANTGAFLLQAPTPAPTLAAPVFLTITGKALEGPPVERSAQGRFLLSKEVNPALATITLDTLAVALDAPDPFRMESLATLELIPAVTKNLPVTLTWSGAVKGPFPPVEINLVGLGEGGKPLPGGVAVMPGTIAPGNLKGDIKATAPAAMPRGRHEIILQAKAKVGGKDVTVVGPVVGLDILPPFELVLEKMVLLQPGQPFVLKGTLKRHPDFKEAVQFKVEGLPAGVAVAAAKPVPGDQGAFQIEFKVDPKAAPAKQEISIVASAAVGGMAYLHPPMKILVEVAKGK